MEIYKLPENSKVVPMPQFGVYTFPWGTAVKDRRGKWTNIFISPNGQEINVENLDVILHENGIEFVGGIDEQR